VRGVSSGGADESLRPDALEPPLSGIRVVSWEHAVAAPLATRHLASLGAEVIKLERPGRGDLARWYDTSVKGASAHFVWLNTGKKSVALDLKNAEELAAAKALIRTADVFVENQAPGVAERLGLASDVLRAGQPELITCAIRGFDGAATQRRKAYDLIIQGEAGVMALTGLPDEPVRAGLPVADIAGAMHALAAILAALLHRKDSGDGSSLEISLYGAVMDWIAPELYLTTYGGEAPRRAGARHVSIVPYGAYVTGDGVRTNIAVQTRDQWVRFCADVLQQPELATQNRFATNEERLRNRAELESVIEAALAALNSRELETRLAGADIPFGRVNELEQVVSSRPFQSRPVKHATVGEETVALLLSPLETLPWSAQTLVVPAVGQHTREVMGELESGTERHSELPSAVADEPRR
jgi:crotonobetainyl-CoA:carnitine CoA-transferase CaiB-like acyl-CoA transferase